MDTCTASVRYFFEFSERVRGLVTYLGPSPTRHAGVYSMLTPAAQYVICWYTLSADSIKIMRFGHNRLTAQKRTSDKSKLYRYKFSCTLLFASALFPLFCGSTVPILISFTILWVLAITLLPSLNLCPYLLFGISLTLEFRCLSPFLQSWLIVRFVPYVIVPKIFTQNLSCCHVLQYNQVYLTSSSILFLHS